ncbi:MAG: MBL fold metallo-hydrolase, partial [Clostridia bacterium]|nr:MBL fold metallo-hydrolase [Clostridia bacterium]
MKKRVIKIIGLILAFTLICGSAAPAFALGTQVTAQADAAKDGGNIFAGIISFFRELFDKIISFFKNIFDFSKKEVIPNTMNKNAIHMLKSVTDTICDSFIITTQDGKVIVIDGGHRTETEYFLKYLKAVTGQEKPHIDAWFLSHAHDDHCEVFLEVAENHADEVSFDKVYANFPEASFYDGYDEWGVYIINEYNRLLPAFADKAAELHEGDNFNVGAAEFTVFYTFNPEWKNVNEGSTIMRMDLGGRSVMFTGDAGVNAGNYVVEKYADSGALDCDICKMAHHGQN